MYITVGPIRAVVEAGQVVAYEQVAQATRREIEAALAEAQSRYSDEPVELLEEYHD